MSRTRLCSWLAVTTALGAAVAMAFALIDTVPDALVTGSTLGALVLTIVTASVLGFVAIRGEVGDRGERTDLREQVHTDSLTGLRNTRAFHEDLARELAVADARGRSLGLVLLDLDGLKTLNDTAGHQAGDQLIVALAETVRANLRARDTAYRVGGDEFAVILRDETTWGAFRFAQRLQGAFAVRPANQRLSAAAGVSASRGQTRDELLREADLALIAAKRGRRGALIYTDDLAVREQGYANPDRIDHRDLVSAALARAVDRTTSSGVGHSEMVAELAAQIAEAMGFAQPDVARIRRAALVHDVGSLAWAHGDASVTREARAAMSETIAAANGLDDEALWIARQYERWDGHRSAHGERTEPLPPPAAIIRVSDEFVELVHRLGDSPDSRDEALGVMARDAGTVFMPDAMTALAAVVGQSRAPTPPSVKEMYT